MCIRDRCRRDARRRRFLDDFLVAALHRAVAFAEVDRVALAVGEDGPPPVALTFDYGQRHRVEICLLYTSRCV